MVLLIRCHDQQIEVELSSKGTGRTVRVGDREIPCDWIRLPDGQFSLILDGRVFDLTVDMDTDRCDVAGRLATHEFIIADPKKLSSHSQAEERHGGLQRICADMPGKVVRVLARPGESVVFDEGLLVLEAMKMQNEIRAPKSGIVKEIGVQEGRAVNTGDFLLSIE